MRILKTLPVFVFLSLLVASCLLQQDVQNQQSRQLNWSNLQITPRPNDSLCVEMLPEEIDGWENIKQDFTQGLSVGFIPENFSIIYKMSYETYWVNPSDDLLFNWLFWYPSGNKESATMRLFILLDEHQLSNALPQPGTYNDIILEPGDDLLVKTRIPPLSPGIHDLIAIGIPYPQSDPDVYGITIVVYRRVTLIVEPISTAFRPIDFASLPAEGSIKRNDPALALELTLQGNGINVWSWPNPWLDVKTNAAINFFALMGHLDVINADAPNLEDLKTSFSSLVLFTDYQQVEVAPGQTAIYSRTENDTAYGRIPITIPSLPEGKHSLLALRIDTPGVPMCILQGDPRSRILPNSIYGKLVGINVDP